MLKLTNRQSIPPTGNSECGTCGYLIRTSSPNCPECGEPIGSQPFKIKRFLLGIDVDTYILILIALLLPVINYSFNQIRPPSDCTATPAQRNLASTQDLIRMSLNAFVLAAVYIGLAMGVIRRIISWKYHFAPNRNIATNTAIACLVAVLLIATAYGNPIEMTKWLYYRFFLK